MATKKATTPGLDPKVADKLLDKLGTDNDFRRLFKKDPAAALVKAGHSKDAAALVGGCCQIDGIAPKAQIQKSRDELKTMLTAGLSMTPVRLDTGTPTSRSRK
ncbi:putative modified peptide [Pseudoluteimonas lycopersici]|uniref:Putative modified peptide n=1 Tax=Pseudoluteimonas lycopersici TaxID=1324796 RepID=A0A516V5Y5_9GAMM|nr:NHLP-related RiPP peptide [Lysobacter lycopersici]QDQ73940.1 putative modified peptide [Lysobacter lycopersici]